MLSHYYRKIFRSASFYWTLPPPQLFASVCNPIYTYQNQTQIYQAQPQQQIIKTHTFFAILRLSCKRKITTIYTFTVPPKAPQSKLINYSNTTQFCTQPINVANTNKTSSSELPQPIQTVSIIDGTLHDISLIFDASTSDLLSSHFSSTTPSQITSNPFNPPQGPVINIERLLSQAHWNHSFNVVNSTPSFQNSLPLSFQGKPPKITLSSNSPTPDIDQYSHHCNGEQPDTTRTYPSLPLKFDRKFVLPPPTQFWRS